MLQLPSPVRAERFHTWWFGALQLRLYIRNIILSLNWSQKVGLFMPEVKCWFSLKHFTWTQFVLCFFWRLFHRTFSRWCHTLDYPKYWTLLDPTSFDVLLQSARQSVFHVFFQTGSARSFQLMSSTRNMWRQITCDRRSLLPLTGQEFLSSDVQFVILTNLQSKFLFAGR